MQGINVRYIHYDNTGGNEALKRLYKQEMGIKLKYITPGMPQQNGRVECTPEMFYNKYKQC